MTAHKNVTPATTLRELCGDFMSAANARRMPRTLDHDFKALAAELKKLVTTDEKNGLTATFDAPALEKTIQGLRHAPAAKTAAEFILENDIRPLARHFRELTLRVVDQYRSDSFYNFHSDGADLVGCVYHGPVTQWMHNADVADRSPSPYGPAYYYEPKDGAPVFSFDNGDLWTQEGWRSQGPDRAFIHRAPKEETGENVLPRLLLLGVRRGGP